MAKKKGQKSKRGKKSLDKKVNLLDNSIFNCIKFIKSGIKLHKRKTTAPRRVLRQGGDI